MGRSSNTEVAVPTSGAGRGALSRHTAEDAARLMDAPSVPRWWAGASHPLRACPPRPGAAAAEARFSTRISAGAEAGSCFVCVFLQRKGRFFCCCFCFFLSLNEMRFLGHRRNALQSERKCSVRGKSDVTLDNVIFISGRPEEAACRSPSVHHSHALLKRHPGSSTSDNADAVPGGPRGLTAGPRGAWFSLTAQITRR